MLDFVYQDTIFRARNRQALGQLADQAVTGVRIAVAYTTQSGVNSLVAALKPRLGKGWAAATKVLITSFDFYRTEPHALDLARKAGFHLYRGWTPGFSFHPKLYVLDTAAGDARLLVGSANLTENALVDNTELGVTLDLAAGTSELDSLNFVWDRLIDSAYVIEDVDLARYRTEWTRNAPKRQPKPRPPRTLRVSSLETVPRFPDEVVAKRLRPERRQRFWIETGSTSSDSHNQIDLPRFANHFFGFSFNEHEITPSLHVIGTVRVTMKGIGSVPRMQKLQWRGRGAKKLNQMERLYLPTVKQGGLDYADTAILFTRARRREVHVLVVPWSGAVARGWQKASANGGKLFTVGGRSPRLCGFL
jgi:HKD family nuclease